MGKSGSRLLTCVTISVPFTPGIIRSVIIKSQPAASDHVFGI
jgi:hypothetical protein